MKSIVVNVGEIKKNNPRLCLSPLRALNRCYECPEYERKFTDKEGNIKIRVCESRIVNKKYEELQKQKRELLDKIKILDEKIKEI